MLQRPIYKERYEKKFGERYTRNNIFTLTKNYCPEAIAIINQFLEEKNVKMLSQHTTEEFNKNLLLNPYFTRKNKNLIINQDHFINEYHSDELELNQHLFGQANTSLDNESKSDIDWNDSNVISIIKSKCTYDDIFNCKNNIFKIIDNTQGAELFNFYNYDIKNAPRLLLNLILLKPYLIHLVYTWDYKEMSKRNMGFAEELAKKVFEPERLTKLSDKYNIELVDLNDIY